MTSPSTTKGDVTSVKAAARTLDMLEAFAAERMALSLSQLAKRLNVPVSSCHQLVGTLEARGYLYVVGRRKEIYPTGKILGIARAIVGHDPWISRVVPLLQELRNRTGETILLGKRQGRHVIYIAVEEGTEAIRFSAGVGDRKPLHISSLGMALLASVATIQREALLRELEARYKHTNVAPNAVDLARDLQQGIQRGWYLKQGGREFDVMAVAAGFAVSTEPFAIGIAGPLQRIVKSKQAFVDALINTRASIVSMLEVTA